MSVTVDFRSDNVGTASPEILEAIVEANRGPAAAYGEDDWSARLDALYSDLFETAVRVFPVSTGTVANAVSLSALTPPYGTIFCHQSAHIHTSEAGAPEFFTGGAKLTLLPGRDHRLDAGELSRVIAQWGVGQRHRVKPAAISLTQASEYGTVYRLDELRAIGAAAQDASLRLHMDGARFANALVALDCTPAQMTWRTGVDILSFGATKNGGLNADAIVLFDITLADDLAYRLRRAGQTWSKMRYAAAQLIAYVQDGLFLRSAKRANAIAGRLARGLNGMPQVELLAAVEANELFVRMPESVVERLLREGFLFHRRAPDIIRLVCRMDGSEDEVDRLLSAARRASATLGDDSG